MKHAPKKLSTAILLALNDLAVVEQKNSEYQIVMDGVWHDASIPSEKCSVCFAGAVMATTCEVKINETTFPQSGRFSKNWRRTFNALNEVRRGKVETAVSMFYGGKSKEGKGYHFLELEYDCDLFTHRGNREIFKDQMLDIAMSLQVNGL